MLVKILYMEVRSYRKPGSIHQVNLLRGDLLWSEKLEDDMRIVSLLRIEKKMKKPYLDMSL